MVIEEYKEGFKPQKELTKKELCAKKYIMYILFALLIYLGGFIYFILALDYEPQHPNEKTDAIITLTGETKRITASIEEFAKGNAKQLFISGVYRQIPIEKVIDKTIISLQKENKLKTDANTLKSKIKTGKAENTIENGIESAVWVNKNKIESIRLITSYYHMPRSKLIFEKYLPNTIKIYHPILLDNKKPNPFTDIKLLTLILSEYNKYIITYLWNLAGLETKTTLKIQGALNV
jgi:uncharacterized SAM-binding protein YcdF (DUF218 family)